jgi:hypothetical protein
VPTYNPKPVVDQESILPHTTGKFKTVNDQVIQTNTMHFVEFTYSGQRKLPTNIKLTAKHKIQTKKLQPQTQLNHPQRSQTE